MSADDDVKRINSISSNWPKRTKHSVEELLETALSYDFDIKNMSARFTKTRRQKMICESNNS